jgi:hypothetical protein
MVRGGQQRSVAFCIAAALIVFILLPSRRTTETGLISSKRAAGQRKWDVDHTVGNLQYRHGVSADRPPRCLVFHHIPKTGGTATLNMLLAQVALALGTEIAFFPYKKIIHLMRQGSEDLRELRERIVYSGHWTPRFVDTLLPHRNCTRFTVLREPVARVISAFNYHLKRFDQWDACLLRNPSPTHIPINKTHCTNQWNYNNDMTRFMADLGASWDLYDYDHYPAPVTEASLEAAKKNLLTMDHVCFIDNLKPCFSRIAVLFNVTLDFNARIVNNSASSEEGLAAWKMKNMANFTSTTREQVTKANTFDVRLYQWAEQTFRNRPEK